MKQLLLSISLILAPTVGMAQDATGEFLQASAWKELCTPIQDRLRANAAAADDQVNFIRCVSYGLGAIDAERMRMAHNNMPCKAGTLDRMKALDTAVIYMRLSPPERLTQRAASDYFADAVRTTCGRT